jgi:quercetin dioxygenase-like cupin family protein
LVLKTGDSFHVPAGLRHQMEALEDSELFEFSTPDFPEDSIRIVPGE